MDALTKAEALNAFKATFNPNECDDAQDLAVEYANKCIRETYDPAVVDEWVEDGFITGDKELTEDISRTWTEAHDSFIIEGIKAWLEEAERIHLL